MSLHHLKQEIKQRALQHSGSDAFIDTEYQSALIFKNPKDNLHPDAADIIEGEWSERLSKPHQNVEGAKEFQSTNSSDALLMSVFCHPQIFKWKGIRQLFGLESEKPELEFGYRPIVKKDGEAQERTEIDMVLDDLYVEAKLTEESFTEKEKEEVEKYSRFSEIFDIQRLPQSDTHYRNYQIIRNILAARQKNKSHILLCDQRRGDLVRSYLDTVNCIKEPSDRKKCRVIFWQEIASLAGKDMKDWLWSRYGF